MDKTLVKSIPDKKSPAVNADQEINNKQLVTPLDRLSWSVEQISRFNSLVEKCNKAKLQRDQAYDEFDGLTYEMDYFANKKAANAYLWPKKNDSEIRVVTGTTEKRLEVLSNELLSMNLQSEIRAYDESDNEIVELGNDINDIVKRTNQMESADDFDQAALRELLSQRALFVADVDEYITINGRPQSYNSVSQPEYAKKVFTAKTIHRARKQLISGLRVYLGDINVPARNFQTDQPYVCIYTRRSYAEAKSIYQFWDRWQYVTAGGANSYDLLSNPFGYRMNPVTNDEVEEIKILDPINNEYDIILNGVPMMEKSTALPYEVSPWRRYNISMVILKEMDTDFAYGKPPVASAKTLQALNDETFRNLIRKWRQALEPPIGVAGNDGRVYSKNIWEPGAVTQGVSKEEFSILNEHNQGVTQSEFNLFDLIERKTTEFIGAGALQAGVAESGDQTAAEIQTLQRNAIKNLGHVVAAFMRYKRDTTYLRIYTILENFTRPVRKEYNEIDKVVQDVFHRFTINDATFENGAKGKKIIQFMDRGITDAERNAMYDYENDEEHAGRPVRIRTLNLKVLQDLLIFWYVTVSQQQRDGSALSKVMFQDTLKQGDAITQMTGRRMNPDKIIDKFEQTWQFKDLFLEEGQQGSPAQVLGHEPEVSPQEMNDLKNKVGMQERSLMGSQMTEGVRGETQRPSLNELSKS